MLKAHICRATADLAPKIHTLLRLAERTGLAYSEEQRVFLARFDRYQIEGRYPDLLPAPPSQDVVRAELKLAGELFQWLKRQL
jgi:HEPN domain-containing protein